MPRKCQECRVDPIYIKSENNPNPPKVPDALFNNVKGAIPIVCTKHKTEGMFNVSHKLCEADGCVLKASFNEPRNIVPRFCETCAHKFFGLAKYENVLTKCKCGKRATVCEECRQCPHNLPKDECKDCEQGSKHCKVCRENAWNHSQSNPDDPPLKMRQARYNFPGRKPIVCHEHKDEGMIDRKHAKCEIGSCEVRAHFNEPGKTGGRFCEEHAKQYLKTYEDVLTKKCGCGKRPSDCAKCKGGNRCKPHNMLKSQCLQCGTGSKICSHGVIRDSCKEHIGSRICKICCERNQNPRYQLTFKPDPSKDETETTKICATCHWKLKLAELLRDAKTPAEAAKILKQKRYAKVKEVRITKDVMDSFPKHTWRRQAHVPLCDDLIPDKRHFTDIEWDISELRKMIFEIDEHQHYLMLCDMSRNFNIVAANRGQYVTFIRYNPDNYKYNDKTVKGTFTYEHEPTEDYDDRMQKVIEILKEEHVRAVALDREFDERVKKISLRLLAKLNQSKLTEAQEAQILTKIQAKSKESLIRIVFINYNENSDAVKEAIEKVGENQVVTYWV